MSLPPTAEIPETPTTPPPAEEPARPLRLSEEIEGLLATVQEQPLHLREMIEVLHGRAYNLLLILLSLPFCQPILIPGLSTPFGWVISIIGLRLALAQKPWLPKRILDANLSPRWVRPLLVAARRLALSMEWLLRPRLVWLLDFTPLHRLYGTIICVCGLLLLLPLPVPFSNLLPSISIALIAAAMMERDGAAVILGIVAFSLNVVFFGALWLGGAEVVGWIKSMFGTGHFEAVD